LIENKTIETMIINNYSGNQICTRIFLQFLPARSKTYHFRDNNFKLNSNLEATISKEMYLRIIIATAVIPQSIQIKN